MQDPDKEFLQQAIAQHGKHAGAIIPLLLAIQRQYNYLPPVVIQTLCSQTAITPAQIKAVGTFYAHFKFEPAAKHAIRVCAGTACHIKGSELIFQAFRKTLNMPEGKDTDAQSIFSVGKVACLGCCMLAPAVQIDQMIYGWVAPHETESILESFQESQKLLLEQPIPSIGFEPIGLMKTCLCSSCKASGADTLFTYLNQVALKYQVLVRPMEVGCLGISFKSPILEVVDSHGKIFHYLNVQKENALSILLHHFKPRSFLRLMDRWIAPFNLERVENLFQERPSFSLAGSKSGGETATDGTRDTKKNTHDFAGWFCGQTKIALQGGGQIAPGDFASYQEKFGFSGLTKALSITPDAVIEAIKRSGLRGRGGGGFPTGIKWEKVRAAKSTVKYVICNGDEGDPGAFMDRMLLESFPFRVIEGMLVAAYATGAVAGYFYIREEYPQALIQIGKAIQTCRSQGLFEKLGIKEGNSFDIKVIPGAGAFVCGEETALIASIEGDRGVPRLRPPYPADCGLYGAPTLINNVETFANIPWILSAGPDKFNCFGTNQSFGTKTFALAGKIKRGGLVEVPMGVSIRSIVEDIGGGVEKGRKLKAVLIGGPSGGCLPPHLLDTKLAFDTLQSVGAMMGSGGIVVLDEHDCMVDIAKYFLNFTANESCGQCTTCRVGTQRMLDILHQFCAGKAKKGAIENLEELAKTIRQGSLCGLGRTAPSPVLSTLTYFRAEYEAHLAGYCAAGKCSKLFQFIVDDTCIGCTLCFQICPDAAIAYTPWEKVVIDEKKCTRCGLCRGVCLENSIQVNP